MKNKVRMLAVISALFNLVTTEAKATECEHTPHHAELNLKLTGETHNADYAEGDVIVVPKVQTKVANVDCEYTGTFRKATNTDGETTDLQTIVHKLSLANDDWKLTFGRNCLREFGGVTTTVGFDNEMLGKGVSRTFTGSFVDYKPLALTLGLVSSDTTMSPSHWDMLLGSWSHRFDDTLGVQVHMAATKDHLEKAGVAVEYHPTDRISLLADAIYGREKSAVMLAGNVQLTDKTKLFAASEVTMPNHEDTTASVIGGVERVFGKNFDLISAVRQRLDADKDTTVLFGLRLRKNAHLL